MGVQAGDDLAKKGLRLQPAGALEQLARAAEHARAGLLVSLYVARRDEIVKPGTDVVESHERLLQHLAVGKGGAGSFVAVSQFVQPEKPGVDHLLHLGHGGAHASQKHVLQYLPAPFQSLRL